MTESNHGFSADSSIRQSELAGQVVVNSSRVAVVLHLFYADQLALFLAYLSKIPGSFDCFVSVKPGDMDRVAVALKTLRNLRSLEVRVFPNVGRDMAPLFVGFASELTGYELILKLHGKKSPHDQRLSDWLSSSLRGLMTTNH